MRNVNDRQEDVGSLVADAVIGSYGHSRVKKTSIHHYSEGGLIRPIDAAW